MNTHRYIARIIIETTTPLFVGSGESSLLKDALVQKDANGMPMIQGTSLVGVLRHAIEDELSIEAKDKWKGIFGHQNGKDGNGSRLRISSAYLMLNENTVSEGLMEIDEKTKAKFDNLPSRQHVRINDKSVKVNGGLFDNEVVYKGARFKFEIELIGNGSDKEIWDILLTQFSSALYRVGQGTRNGYGNLKVLNTKAKIFNLANEADFNAYTNFDTSLNNDTCLVKEETTVENKKDGLTHYKLELEPDGLFFNFSEGFGDDEVDNKPLTEDVIIYDKEKIDFKENQTVIPASSIKGAIAHRTAFHYNKFKKIYVDVHGKNIGMDKLVKLVTGGNNKAVNELFGVEANFKFENNENEIFDNYKANEKTGQRGKVIINDIYFNESQIDNCKIFNHVAIDRFTGGAMSGALFSEKSSMLKGDYKLIIEIAVERNTDDDITKAMEEALKDMCDGLLPLGGMTTKGNGIFTGTLLKNEIKNHTYGDARNK
jgi:CRISPR/Cas system CSM-associated protein Csm3 (group 7 of RAMP superfamily)